VWFVRAEVRLDTIVAFAHCFGARGAVVDCDAG
jgi:hypothetical protein